jgi:hypothetical protein
VAASVKTASPSIPLADKVFRLVDFVADNSYPTNGYALTAAQFGLSKIDMVIPLSSTGHLPVFDIANSKLKFFHGDNGNASAGPAIEVANLSATLNAVSVRLFVIGEPI